LVATLGHVCGETPSLQADKLYAPLPQIKQKRRKNYFLVKLSKCAWDWSSSSSTWSMWAHQPHVKAPPITCLKCSLHHHASSSQAPYIIFQELV